MEAYFVEIGVRVVEHLMETPWWVLLIEGVAIASFYVVLEGIYLLVAMRFVTRHNSAFSQVTEPLAPNILITGDSTAVGTGARDPKHTIAGFLAHDFPKMNIVNVAENGALTCAVQKQLTLVDTKKFDMIIISTGGNDVWAFTSLTKLRADFKAILKKAKAMSDHRVIVLFFGNEGSAPFFPALLRPLLMKRTEKINTLFHGVAHEERVPLIELFTQQDENPFIKDPKTFFAADGLHPSDAGYWEWYKRVWRLMIEQHFVFSAEEMLNSR